MKCLLSGMKKFKNGENMKIKRKSSVVIALVFSALMSNSASAWDDTVTHIALTERAVNLIGDNWFSPYLQNNLGFKKNVQELLPYENEQETILDILRDGSKEEDNPLSRGKNHFHNPLQATNEAGLDAWTYWPLPRHWGGKSNLAWALGDVSANENSWKQARNKYKEAFEALRQPDEATRQAEFEENLADTFLYLGQVMHLVQDMAVPAHTRNDIQGAGGVSAA